MDINEKIEALRQEARAEYEAAVKRADAARAAMRTLGIEVDAVPVIAAPTTSPVIAPQSESLPLFTAEKDVSDKTPNPNKRIVVHKKQSDVTHKIMSHLTKLGVTPEVKIASVAYQGNNRAMELVRRPLNKLISHGYIVREDATVPGPSKFCYRVTSIGRSWWSAVERGEAILPKHHKGTAAK